MISEGLDWLLNNSSFVLTPLSYQIPTGQNPEIPLEELYWNDLGYRSINLYFGQKDEITTIEYGDRAYNTLGITRAISLMVLVGGKPINPSYGVLTASNRLEFFGNGTNFQEVGDSLKLFNYLTGEFLLDTTVIFSDPEQLLFTPTLNGLPLNETYIKAVNSVGEPIGVREFRNRDIDFYANDNFVPIVNYYRPDF